MVQYLVSLPDSLDFRWQNVRVLDVLKFHWGVLESQSQSYSNAPPLSTLLRVHHEGAQGEEDEHHSPNLRKRRA